MITASRLIGVRVGAPDGIVGRVRDVLFEDDSWRVRWLVVRLHGGRAVLMPPVALRPAARRGFPASVALSAAEIRRCPAADSDLPVARCGEGHLAGLFRPASAAACRCDAEARPGDPRLQSCRELATYAAMAAGEPLGPIRDVLLDEADWTVSALILGGGRWGFGRGSAVPASRIRAIDWEDGTVRLLPEGAAMRGGSAGMALSPVDPADAFRRRIDA